jgi:hypothetical protein
VQEDDIMKIVESNAITLILAYYSLSQDAGDLEAKAYDSFIVIDWSRQLEKYPAWVHTIKQRTPTTAAYTCINFPKGGVSITPDECEWGMEEQGLEGYKMAHMDADGVRYMISFLFQGDDYWQECACLKPRKHYVDLIMSVLDDTKAQRVFSSRRLKLLANPQESEIYVQGCTDSAQLDGDWQPLASDCTDSDST